MSDLLSFIAGNLKQNRMTVDEFCRKVGISRQKFYRFVKEPRRFSGDQIRSIIEVLSLSDSEVQTLESYMYLKVRLLFDPPTNSGVTEATNRMIDELEFRINAATDFRKE